MPLDSRREEMLAAELLREASRITDRFRSAPAPALCANPSRRAPSDASAPSDSRSRALTIQVMLRALNSLHPSADRILYAAVVEDRSHNQIATAYRLSRTGVDLLVGEAAIFFVCGLGLRGIHARSVERDQAVA